jgi:hypothetical protein
MGTNIVSEALNLALTGESPLQMAAWHKCNALGGLFFLDKFMENGKTIANPFSLSPTGFEVELGSFNRSHHSRH